MKNDYVIHLRSFEGGLEIANSQGIVSPAYTILRSKKPCAPLFFDSYFHTDEFINHVLYKAVEGIRDGRQISYEAFKWLPIPHCSLEEQIKIASVIERINLRIKKQSELVEHLKKYKRGVLNSIFSSKSNAQDSGILLSDICSSISSGKTKITTANGKYPLFGSTGIVGSTDCAECSGKIVLVARVGANAGLVNYFEGVCGVTDNTLVLKFTDQAVLPKFVYHYLQYYDVNKMVFGSGQPLVTGGQLKSIVLPNLKSDEIERIVAFFDLLDSRISCAEKELFNLNLFKKSIYQNMFI